MLLSTGEMGLDGSMILLANVHVSVKPNNMNFEKYLEYVTL